VIPGPELPAAPDVPRGRWRVTPVRAGFPPVADATFRLDVGAPVPPPVVESVGLEPPCLVVRGRHLTETSWLEVEIPGGPRFQLLPEARDGELRLPLPADAPSPAGAVLRVVSPPPGGGPCAPVPLG
jgi:hypothetical protein